MFDRIEYASNTLRGTDKELLPSNTVEETFSIMKNQNQIEGRYGMNLIKSFIWTLNVGQTIGLNDARSIPAQDFHFVYFIAYIRNHLASYLARFIPQNEGGTCQRSLLEPADLVLKAWLELNSGLKRYQMHPEARRSIGNSLSTIPFDKR